MSVQASSTAEVSRAAPADHGKKNRTGWFFVLPALITVLAITVFPTIYSIWLSFLRWEPTSKDHSFIGLENYATLFRDDRFWHSIGVTALLVVVGVFLELVLGFLFADYVVSDTRNQRWIVTLMLLPVMVMPVVVGYTWRLLWDAQYGPINQMIGWVIGEPFYYTWLGQTNTALFAVLVTEIWQWTPFMFLVSYAGLMSMDREVLEAAEMDGANAWHKLWRIVLPLMLPILIVAVLIRALDAIKAFDVIYTMTAGAPGTSTETVSYFIYKSGYQFFRLGFGAAASVVVLLILSVLLSFLLRRLRRQLA
jgi:multiple sugar transport system permease protein